MKYCKGIPLDIESKISQNFFGNSCTKSYEKYKNVQKLGFEKLVLEKFTTGFCKRVGVKAEY